MSSPRPRTASTPGSGASASASCAPYARDVVQQLVVDRVDDRARGGAGHGVAAEGRAVVAGGERRRPHRRATRSAPIGRPFARPFASVTRSGRRRAARTRRTARAADARLHLVEAQQLAPAARPRLRRTRGRADGRRLRPGRARAGSARRRRRGCARSASTSFGGTNAHSGHAAARSRRFAGCPVAESAPSVRPWKLPSSATTPGFPVALRAYLSAASFASAPELQKNAWAPPKRSESRAASSSSGSVGTGSTTCQRRSSCACAAASGAGMAVAERDDREPGPKSRYRGRRRPRADEPSPRDEGHVGARVGRKERSSPATSGHVLMRAPPSRRSRAATPSRAARDGGSELRHDPAFEARPRRAAGPPRPRRLRSPTAPSTQTPGHVGHEEDAIGPEPDGERARRPRRR